MHRTAPWQLDSLGRIIELGKKQIAWHLMRSKCSSVTMWLPGGEQHHNCTEEPIQVAPDAIKVLFGQDALLLQQSTLCCSCCICLLLPLGFHLAGQLSLERGQAGLGLRTLGKLFCICCWLQLAHLALSPAEQQLLVGKQSCLWGYGMHHVGDRPLLSNSPGVTAGDTLHIHLFCIPNSRTTAALAFMLAMH